jgi:small ligand-binding sensory domain FIST
MRFASAISTAARLEAACKEAAATALSELGNVRADLAVLFVSPAYGDLAAAPRIVAAECAPRRLAGCTGGGIAGGGREVESQPAVAVALASLPDVELTATVLADTDLPGGDDPPSRWTETVGMAAAEAAAFVVLPEPFTSAADRVLAGLDFAYPQAPKVGGIVSGSRSPSGNALFLDHELVRSGALVVGLSGNVVVDTVVAQGCKPFGKIGRITNAENHHLIAVDGQRALEFVREQLATLDAEDLNTARSGQVFLGMAMDPFATGEPQRGDFLIRNLLGFDQQSGMVAVGDQLSVGRRVQMHLRDGGASHDDLELMLGRELQRTAAEPRHAGALLFSCLGRGQGLYGEPDHDSRLFHSLVGDIPLAGFFCNGEIGPVQGTTYLHGYTSSFGLFRPRTDG